MSRERTPAKKKAQELAKFLSSEQPDYFYLKNVFRHLRTELQISVPKATQQQPNEPNDLEVQRFYEVVWHTRNFQDMVLIKTLLYTQVRISELINIQLDDIDFENCQIRIISQKEDKKRIVQFPVPFKAVLVRHVDSMRCQKATYLFESSWKRQYSERGIRKILERYAKAAGLSQPMSPKQLCHFLLTWLKKQGIDETTLPCI